MQKENNDPSDEVIKAVEAALSLLGGSLTEIGNPEEFVEGLALTISASIGILSTMLVVGGEDKKEVQEMVLSLCKQSIAIGIDGDLSGENYDLAFAGPIKGEA